ncbi:MAG: rod shape-determining protein MreC, partial [Bacteroidota bacterium]|nr:rod shape-determining protein MreC [Bacteroidota bacterium]
MRRLLNFFILFKEYVVLTGLVFLSFFFMALSRSTEVQPLRAVTTIFVGSLQSLYSWIPNPFVLSKENTDLRARNIILSSELAQLRRAKGENEELRKLLGLKPRSEWKLLAAEIVGKTSIGDRNMLTLSAGESSGIKKGMAVMTDGGLIGRVYSTSGGFSLVEGLFNRDMRVAVKISRTRVDGILGWEGGDELIVRNVPKALDVKEGDLVVTSEYSTFFPSEVPIGTIIRLEPEPNTMFRKIFVAPAAHPFRVEHCYVVLKDDVLEQEKAALQLK